MLFDSLLSRDRHSIETKKKTGKRKREERHWHSFLICSVLEEEIRIVYPFLPHHHSTFMHSGATVVTRKCQTASSDSVAAVLSSLGDCLFANESFS